MPARQRRYIADLHFGHDKVAHLRGYPSAWHHDLAIIDAWGRSDIGHTTEVFILGDLSAGSAEAERRAHVVIDALPGVKHLVLGNHDRLHPLQKNGRKHFTRYAEVFASVSTADQVSIGGHRVMLSHFPYQGDHDGTEERYAQWRLRDEGRWLVHGHVHEAWKVNGRQINVGFDHWRDRFATDSDITRIMEEGPDVHP